jgi:hypothetical protein
MGFEAIFFGRMNEEDVAARKKNKEMEFIW